MSSFQGTDTCGKISVTATSTLLDYTSSGGWGIAGVTFAVPYTSTPVVTLTSSSVLQFLGMFVSVTPSGFQVLVNNQNLQTTGSYSFNYMVMGLGS